MNLKEILELINAVDKSSLNRFSYKEGNTEIELDKQVTNVNNEIKDKEILNKEYDDLKKSVKVDEFKSIKSSLIGTFYASPTPKGKPFVSVGDKISKNQVIGIIEVMKMMNEIKSDVDGIVEEILVENNETVEYGQDLIKVKEL